MRFLYFTILYIVFYNNISYSADLYETISLFEEGQDGESITQFLEIYNENNKNEIALAYLFYYKTHASKQLQKSIPKTIYFDSNNDIGEFIKIHYIQPGIIYRNLKKTYNEKEILKNNKIKLNQKNKDYKKQLKKINNDISNKEKIILSESEKISNLNKNYHSMRGNYLSYKLISRINKTLNHLDNKKFDIDCLPDFGFYLAEKEVIDFFINIKKPIKNPICKILEFVSIYHLIFAASTFDNDALKKLIDIPREDLQICFDFQLTLNPKLKKFLNFMLLVLDCYNEAIDSGLSGLELDHKMLRFVRTENKQNFNILDPIKISKKMIGMGDLLCCELLLDTYTALNEKNISFYYASIGAQRGQEACSLEYANCLLEKDFLDSEARKFFVSLLKDNMQEKIKEKLYINLELHFVKIIEYIADNYNSNDDKWKKTINDLFTKKTIKEIQSIINHSDKNTEKNLLVILLTSWMIYSNIENDDSYYKQKGLEYGYFIAQKIDNYEINFLLYHILCNMKEDFIFQEKSCNELIKEQLKIIVKKTNKILKNDKSIQKEENSLCDIKKRNLDATYKLVSMYFSEKKYNKNLSKNLKLLDHLIDENYGASFFIKADYEIKQNNSYDLNDIINLNKKGIDLLIEQGMQLPLKLVENLSMMLYSIQQLTEAKKYLQIACSLGSIVAPNMLEHIQDLSKKIMEVPNSLEKVNPAFIPDVNTDVSEEAAPSLLSESLETSAVYSDDDFQEKDLSNSNDFDPEPWKKYQNKKNKENELHINILSKNIESKNENEKLDEKTIEKMHKIMDKINSNSKPSAKSIKNLAGKLINLFPETSSFTQGNGSRAQYEINGKKLPIHEQHNNHWGNKMDPGRFKDFKNFLNEITLKYENVKK
ncbi:MAG: hypothetical protein Q8K60_08675 [Parachlamydiaceae bacterium]|nr:hypothetical protein [Parachlamydiaceae bacterium]